MSKILESEEKTLRRIVREEVSGVMEKTLMRITLSLVPEISDKEQKEIEKLYGEPDKKAVRIIEA
jgi:hypothetical protein